MKAAFLAALVTLSITALLARTQTTTPPDESTSTEPTPQPRKEKRFQFGPEVGYFRLFDGRARNRFGDGKAALGVGFTRIDRPTRKGDISFDFKLFNLKEGANRALWAPIGARYKVALVPDDESRQFLPYAGVSASIVPARIKVPVDNIDERFTVGVGGSVFLGTMIGRKAYVEGRVFGISRLAGYQFSGAALAAGLRF